MQKKKIQLKECSRDLTISNVIRNHMTMVHNANCNIGSLLLFKDIFLISRLYGQCTFIVIKLEEFRSPKQQQGVIEMGNRTPV